MDEPAVKDHSKKAKADVNEIENSSAKLFEEIKIMFQDLPARIERTNTTLDGRRRKRRFHPAMLEDLMHFTKDPKIGLKVALSLYRNKMPWIYDEGIILLNKIESAKTPTTINRLFEEFEVLLKQSTRNPIIEEFFIDDKDEFELFSELPMFILRTLHNMMH